MELVHTSVMVGEVLQLLAPNSGDSLLVDCTVGEGGHAEAFLKQFPHLRIIGLDADKVILEKARERLLPFGDRFRGIESWFDEFFANYPLNERPDRIFFDLGISTYHFERSGRGFSFLRDEILDMRLGNGMTALELINTASEKELADIFFNWGEERYARRIAHEIVRTRKSSSIRSSKQLAQIIWEAVPPSYRYGRIHPATRSFQALRIAVNHEMERLERALKGAFTVLKVGGRLGVLSFHSLEDRRVKQFFQEKNKTCICGPETPICNCGHKRSAVWITRKIVQPTPQEVSLNAASRSAKFRVIEKIDEESTV